LRKGKVEQAVMVIGLVVPAGLKRCGVGGEAGKEAGEGNNLVVVAGDEG
jgi:hypothetical protein